MKIIKVFRKLFQSEHVQEIRKNIPSCPMIYDRNNVTAEEFRKYVHWLAENHINKTFYEPDKFITQAECEALAKRKAEFEKYRKFIGYLAENNINRTFYC